jgi:hypothetical protein
LEGANLVPGQPSDQTAYRSELAGLFGIMIVYKLLCQVFKVHKGFIEIACDGLVAGQHILVYGFSPASPKITSRWSLLSRRCNRCCQLHRCTNMSSDIRKKSTQDATWINGRFWMIKGTHWSRPFGLSKNGGHIICLKKTPHPTNGQAGFMTIKFAKARKKRCVILSTQSVVAEMVARKETYHGATNWFDG